MRGRTTRFCIPAAQFSGMSWVVEHLGARALVMPGLSLKDHARAAIQLLSGAMPRRQNLYPYRLAKNGTRLGVSPCWRGDWAAGCMPGIEVVLGKSLARYALTLPGSADEARHAVQASLGLVGLGLDQVIFPVYCAIWRAALGHVDHGVHLVGQTGAGKTALAALAQQHYGPAMDAEGLPASWSSTGNALEGLAFLAKDALLTIDDFCPAGTQADIQRYYKDADRVFRAQGNTSGRQRMRPDGTLRPDKPPRGLILSTGEDIPPGQSLRARCLILEVPAPLLRDHTGAFAACQAAARTGEYARAMAGFLHWLAPKYDIIQQAMPQDLALLRQQVSVDGHLRTPGIVAQLALGLQTFLAYAAECGAVTDGQHDALWQRGWAALCDVAGQQAVQQTQEDEVQRFLSALAGALTAGDAHAADAHRPGAPCAWPEWGGAAKSAHSDNNSGSQRTTTTWRAQGRCIGWVDGDDSILTLRPPIAWRIVSRLPTSAVWSFRHTPSGSVCTNAACSAATQARTKIR